MTLVVALFAESRSDATIAALLLDRAVAEDARTPNWVSDALDAMATATDSATRAARESVRQFVDEDGERRGEAYIDLHRTADVLSRLRLTHRAARARGKFDRQPGEPDALAVRSAAEVVRLLNVGRANVALLVYMRDVDHQAARHEGHRQARVEATSLGDAFEIVVAAPEPCREAWACACVEATDVARAKLTRELGLDPVTASHRLDHRHTGHRSAEKVLRALGVSDFGAELALLRATTLARMRERGGSNGLAAYLDELSQRAAPLVSSRPPTA